MIFQYLENVRMTRRASHGDWAERARSHCLDAFVDTRLDDVNFWKRATQKSRRACAGRLFLESQHAVYGCCGPKYAVKRSAALLMVQARQSTRSLLLPLATMVVVTMALQSPKTSWQLVSNPRAAGAT